MVPCWNDCRREICKELTVKQNIIGLCHSEVDQGIQNVIGQI